MKEKEKEISPLIKAYLLINQIASEKNINNSLFELKNMCKIYGDEFIKNVNLISFNHINFKEMKNQNEFKSFFILNFPEFIENKNFMNIFTNLLMDAKNDYTVHEIFNGLNYKFNLNIENQIKLIICFINSGDQKYSEDANLLFLLKCKEIYDKKLFFELKNKYIVEKMINILFNILKIKNRQNDKDIDNNNKNNIDEANIQLYIQAFSHYNEQLKTNFINTIGNSINNIIESEEKSKIESNIVNNDINCINNKIEIEKLLYELGPFIINYHINLSQIPFVDSNLDLNRLNKLILFLINNQNNCLNKGIKYLNKIFLEAMNIDTKYIDLLNSLEINKEIEQDINSIYELFKINMSNIDKLNLLNSFDNPLFIMDNKKKFDFFEEFLIRFIFLGENINNALDFQLFFDSFTFAKWKNIPNQLIFLELLITNKELSQNSVFALKNYQGQKIRKDVELKSYISSKNLYLIENWRNVKLIETLILISEGENYSKVKKLMDWALKNIPEIIILALLVIKIDYSENLLMKDLILEILTPILNDKMPRLKLIDEIWQTNKDIVIFTLYNSWSKCPDLMNLSLIFDLSNSLLKDSLLPLVNSKYHNFSVHLGLLASKRDYLHIENWLKKSIENYGDDFINSLLDYLKINIIKPCQINLNQKDNNKASILEKAQLSLESLSIILNILNSYNTQSEKNNDKLSLKTKKEIEKITKIIFDIYDEIQDQQINSEEIEEEVSKLLRNLFNEKISVDEVIKLLIKYKSSENKKENEIYSCLIHGLLDEYRFYSQYPKDKLRIISELFGKIINNKLLEGIIETLCLNYILEGIKSDYEILYFFGINALLQFIKKISHWPSYMKILLGLEKIKQNKKIYLLILQESEKFQKKNISESSEENSDKYIPLISISRSENKSIEDNINNNVNSSINNENISPLNKEIDNKEKENEAFDKLKIKLTGETKSFIDYEYNNYQNNMDYKKIEIPNEDIINKTKLIFDNLNKSNINEKSVEIINLLGNDEKLIRWFSYYFTTTKINHWKNIPFRIFNELFIQVNNPILNKYLLKDTIKYIQELLSLDYLYIDDKCKSILKNLGTWIGLNTIAKNKPILAKDIDFRELITNSYKKGELKTIVPFICKVFANITKSKIFNVNNPWVNSILGLLKEIYHKSLLSFELKKEIESFFELMKLEMSAISNDATYLKNLKKLDTKNHDFPASQKYQINIDIKELRKKIGSLNDYINNLINILNNDNNTVNGFYYNNKNFDYFNNLTENESGDNEGSNISNSSINNKNLYNHKDIISILTNIMNQCILDSIPDLITLFVENPINSAITIVNKDFTFESDLNKYITALDNILQFILKSFSILGGHDKLKRNIDIDLEKYYKAKHLRKETIIKIKELPNSEYINIGLEYIEMFIMKEAKNRLNINKKVLDEINKRKNGNLSLYKNNKEYIKKISKLPKELKPNEQYIKDNEFKVYESFKINGFKLFEEDTDKSLFINTVYRILKEVIDKAELDNSPNKIITYKSYDLCMKNIQNISKRNIFIDYNEDEDLICLKKIITDSKIYNKEINMQLALNTFKYIMDSVKINNFLLLNAYIYILRGWVKMNNEISNKITDALFEYDVDIFIKFKYELHLYFIKKNILNLNLYENYMIKLLKSCSVPNIIIINLLNHLLANHTNNDNNNTNKSQKSLFCKIKSYYYDNISKTYYLLFNKKTSTLNNLSNKYIDCIINKNKDEDKNEMKDSCVQCFIKIIHYFYYSLYNYGNASNLNPENEKLLSNDDLLIFNKDIYRLCFNKIYDERTNQYMNYYYPENLSIFIFYIINKTNDENKIPLFRNIFNFIINIFNEDYTLNQINFNQKKYYKLFLNLIYLISNNSDYNQDSILKNISNKMDYLLIICQALKILSPMNYPGFLLAWLDLISYNYFIDNYLDKNLIKENSDKYEKYLSLLTEILSYLSTLKNKSINHYYFKIVLDRIYKFFFILSKTYSSFIAIYNYILLSYLQISSETEDEDNNSFLQLRNIFLSATPINFIKQKNKLNINAGVNDDFYNENENFLNMKLLSDNFISNKIICILLDSVHNELNNEESELKKLLDKYILEINKENVLESIFIYLENIKEERELYIAYNGLMLYWSNKVERKIFENKIKNNFFNFYNFLLYNLNEVHKKYLIDSILNALKFPCSQTINFSILFQELFINIGNEDLEKQLIVNILERMLYKPIPWGIKYALNNLFNNEKYRQLEKKYINENQEIVNFIKKISANFLEDDTDIKNHV